MNSGVAIYQAIEDENFRFVAFNKSAERITNVKRKDVIGKTLLELFPNMKGGPLLKALLENI